MIHQGLYEDLLQVQLIQESAQVDKLFEILERTFLAFGHYSSYLTANRQQNILVRKTCGFKKKKKKKKKIEL